MVVPLFPPSTLPIFDLDATQSASYSGSGTTWHNLVTQPADGSAQSAYDFTISGTPTFTGTPGTSGCYFAMDGTAYFEIAGGNTAFINNLGKATSDGLNFWPATTATIIIAFKSDAGPTMGKNLWGTDGGAGGSVYGISLAMTTVHVGGGSGAQFGFQFYSPTLFGQDTTVVPAASTDYLAAVAIGSLYNVGGNIVQAINNSNLQEGPSSGGITTLTANQNSPANPFRIASSGAGNPVASGTRIYGCYAFASSLTDDQYKSFISVLNARQGNRWSF